MTSAKTYHPGGDCCCTQPLAFDLKQFEHIKHCLRILMMARLESIHLWKALKNLLKIFEAIHKTQQLRHQSNLVFR